MLFSVIRLNERQNTGAALGNIAFDRWNKQFLVSDLETGMIHRISLEGRDLGSFDHGTQGRTSFVDAQSGQSTSLQPIAFNPASQARIANCEGQFDNTPECWNIAESNRRVWGLGVWKGPNGETRLYYSVASSPDLGGSDWASLPDEEKRNTLWSVRLGPDGSFDASGVRREFVLPDFFGNPQDVARAGYSRPVSDITFPACSGRPVMLVAERGGLRNLGLGRENAFATPHEARTIRYELDQTGTWRAVGRYDIGILRPLERGRALHQRELRRRRHVRPRLLGRRPRDRAGRRLRLDLRRQAVLAGGPVQCAGRSAGCRRSRCRREAVPTASTSPTTRRCTAPKASREDMYNALVPPSATAEKPQQVNPVGPGQAYMVDFDINVDARGQPDPGTDREERCDHDRRHQRLPDLPAGQRGLLVDLSADGGAGRDHPRPMASATTGPARTRASSATGAGIRTAAGRAMTVAGRTATNAPGRTATGVA